MSNSTKQLEERQQSQQTSEQAPDTPEKITWAVEIIRVDKVSWFITPAKKPRMYQPYFIRLTNGDLWPEVIHPGTDREDLKRMIAKGKIYTYEQYRWEGEAWQGEFENIRRRSF